MSFIKGFYKSNNTYLNPVYTLSLISILFLLCKINLNLFYELIFINNKNSPENKVIQIQEGRFNLPVTYYVNKYNIDDLQHKLGIHKSEIIHGIKYYKSRSEKFYHSEPIDAIHKISLNIPININIASESDLISLPGIGNNTAINIIKYRKENGNFSEKRELMNVYGIGKIKFNKIENYISVN